METAAPAQLEEIYKRYGGKKQLERMLETLKSEEWIECNSKSCPSCGSKIEVITIFQHLFFFNVRTSLL